MRLVPIWNVFGLLFTPTKNLKINYFTVEYSSRMDRENKYADDTW